ncbi:uncharacterized protein BX663DRAFT_280606 [Cokeromyces recurvatus]|uniref:uncharacterized protein n=1 Tax=Cokeromyces recurvatus TaxID=90255 RepID=UPI00221FE48C|nr:uncharacterized protein BX663DRAFT_280606 [Cokeromyces recurvatus]KAI7905391.1 hypothetical protein BX663DRAFT_280606 [Cokeromyces recurvatus]
MSFISSSSNYHDIIPKKRWLKINDGSSLVHPLHKSPTDIPSSSVKRLFPSLSMFNLPSSMVLSPTTTLCDTPSPSPSPPSPLDPSFIQKLFLSLSKSSSNPSEQQQQQQQQQQEVTTTVQPLEAVQLLLERLEAWYLLTTRLLRHFQRLASIERYISKIYDRRFVSPHQANIFTTHPLLDTHFDPSFKGGIRHLCHAWYQHHLDRIQQHTDLSHFLKQEAIPVLQKIKRDLRQMMRSIRTDDRLSSHTLKKLECEANRRLDKLEQQLRAFDEQPHECHMKQDPWLMNAGNR